MPTIDQGGNSFGTSMDIGTNDPYNLNFRTNGSLKAWFDAANAHLWVVSLANQNTANNSVVKLDNAGTIITRNVANGDPALTVNQQNSGSTGNIANFQFGGTTVSKVTKDGFVFGTRLGANSTGANPQYPLDINSGTNPISILIGKFSQNNGSVQIENGTVAPNNFAPTIRGTANGSFPWGILVQGQGAASYSRAGVILRVSDAAGTGPVTSGNTFQLENNTTSQLSVDYQGVIKAASLAGTGNRMITADSTGTLAGTTALTVDGSGNVVIANNIEVSGSVTGIPGMGPLSLYAGSGVKVSSTGNGSVFNTTNLTADRTVQMPDAHGTAAAIGTTAPSSATDTGVVGEIRVTSTYVYVCIATNTWVRAPFATF